MSTVTNSITYSGNQATELLLTPLVERAVGISDFRVIFDVTGKTRVPTLAGLQETARDGSSCSTTEVGAVTLSDYVLQPQPVVHNLGFCKYEFKASYLAGDFPANSNDFTGTELIEAIEQYAGEGVMNDQYDLIFWGNASGVTATYLTDPSVTGLYEAWDGGANMLTATDMTAGLATSFATGASATLGKDEAWTILENLIDAQSLELDQREGKAFHVSRNFYRNLKQSLNGYNTSAGALRIVPSEVTGGVSVMEYDGIPIIKHSRWDSVFTGNSGLGFNTFAVLTANENNVIAIDGTDASLDVWYSKDDDKVKMRANYEIDTNITFDSLYVAYKNV